jgi:hypothetical protein
MDGLPSPLNATSTAYSVTSRGEGGKESVGGLDAHRAVKRRGAIYPLNSLVLSIHPPELPVFRAGYCRISEQLK